MLGFRAGLGGIDICSKACETALSFNSDHSLDMRKNLNKWDTYFSSFHSNKQTNEFGINLDVGLTPNDFFRCNT